MPTTMRLCFLAPAGSIHTHKWLRYFAETGHDVHLICPYADQTTTIDGVTVHTQPDPVASYGRGSALLLVKSRIALAMRVRKLRALLRRLRPDILHAHFLFDYGFLGALARFHPFVVTGWGTDVLLMPHSSVTRRLKARMILRRADLATCDAEHVAAAMARLGCPKDRIKVMMFGIDTAKFSPAPAAAGSADATPRRPPTVISLRSLQPMYNVETLIRAVPLVLQSVPSARFLIYGRGEQRDFLGALAATLGVAASVDFPGAVPNDDLPRCLQAADVYVSTSLSDGGIAASTLEAMACGLPVVITDFGNNRDWIEDGVGGFLIPLKSPQVLADRVVRLLMDAEARAACGRVNRDAVVNRNDYRTEMAKMATVYRALVGRQQL